MYCAKSLIVAQRLMEDPKRYICSSDTPPAASREGADILFQSALPEE
jgi:hypothetical protein